MIEIIASRDPAAVGTEVRKEMIKMNRNAIVGYFGFLMLTLVTLHAEDQLPFLLEKETFPPPYRTYSSDGDCIPPDFKLDVVLGDDDGLNKDSIIILVDGIDIAKIKGTSMRMSYFLFSNQSKGLLVRIKFPQNYFQANQWVAVEISFEDTIGQTLPQGAYEYQFRICNEGEEPNWYEGPPSQGPLHLRLRETWIRGK